MQAVNFRWTTVEEAQRLGLTGRVWNREDGAVEVVAEGEPAAIDRLAAWLARGPRHARVEGVDRAALDGERRYAEFTVSRGEG